MEALELDTAVCREARDEDVVNRILRGLFYSIYRAKQTTITRTARLDQTRIEKTRVD
jgi:hypothetical protein